MRYFLSSFILLCLVVVSIAGFRGERSRRPPIELFPDMDRQPKLRPQEHNNFFPDQLSSRRTVEGTEDGCVAYAAIPPSDLGSHCANGAFGVRTAKHPSGRNSQRQRMPAWPINSPRSTPTLSTIRRRTLPP